MSIEPTCDYCGYSDKFRCKTQVAASSCTQYKEVAETKVRMNKLFNRDTEQTIAYDPLETTQNYPGIIGQAGEFGTSGEAGETGTREHLGKNYTRLVPLEAIAAGAASLEYGAKKYAARNWEKGLSWQTMLDSLKRHIEDFERGSDYDDSPDGSGLHQVCMIMASAMMLSASVVRNIGEDDRLEKSFNTALSAKDCLLWLQNELDESNSRIKMKNSE